MLTNGFDDEKASVSTDKDKDKELETDKELDKDIFSVVPAELKKAFVEYQQVRNSMGKGYKSKNAVKRAVNTLQELAPDDFKVQRAIIYQASDGGYTQFVPLLKKVESSGQDTDELLAKIANIKNEMEQMVSDDPGNRKSDRYMHLESQLNTFQKRLEKSQGSTSALIQ